MSPKKTRSLIRRYRDAYFAIGKWDTDLDPLAKTVRGALDDCGPQGWCHLLRFLPESASRFIDDRGGIDLEQDKLDRVRLM